MSDEAAPEPEPEVAPPPAPAKKRKKKKRSAESNLAGLPPGWPEFAARFPRDPVIEELVEAFEKGNYARVREGARRILAAEPAKADDVRSAARELIRRIDPDPIAIYLLAGASLLLAFLAIWYWSHGHGAQ